ncbi:hypothetical protein ECEC1865_0787, partial [Escherichia coli EC1865]
QRNI